MGGKVAFRNIGGQAALFDAVEEFRPEPSLAYQQGVGGDGSGVIGEVREGGVDAVDMRGVKLPAVSIDYLSEQIMLRENSGGGVKASKS